MKNWFDHDYGARNDERILELRAEYGAEGYGLYWMLLESLAENSGYLNKNRIGGLSLAYGVVKATLEGVLKLCLEVGLFKCNDKGVFWSERMMLHVQKVNALSEAGKKGAEARKKNRLNNENLSHVEATLKPPLSHPLTEEKRIEENRREEIHTHTQSACAWEGKGYDKPESMKQVTEHALMKGFKADVAERYWNKRRSTGWTKAQGNQQVPIQDWRADFASIAHYLQSDLQKEKSGGKTNNQKTIYDQTAEFKGKPIVIDTTGWT